MKRHQRFWAAAFAIALLVAGTIAVRAWREHSHVDRIRASLPVLPKLTGKPAVLGELLAKAQAAAWSNRKPLEAVVELGRLYHANDYRAQAEICWRLLRREQPNEARWCYYLADLRRAASDYEEMAALLVQTVKLAPDYAPAWLQLAGLNFKNGRFEPAEANYRRRLALLPGDPYSKFGIARIALQSGRRDEARVTIEQLVREAPDFAPSHNVYAEMLAAEGDVAGARRQRWLGREAGRFRDAEDPWLSELTASCYDPKRLYVLATIEFQTNRGERGRGLFKRAIQLAPDDPDGYEQLGDLYLKLDEAAQARDTLEQALRLRHSGKPHAMLFVNLSHAYRVLKQPAEALRVAQEGIQQAGEAFELYDALGAALGDLNRQEEAVAAFHEAIARNPNDANSNFNLSISLFALGRQEEAYAALQRSLTLQPTFPKALSILGKMELEAGRLDEAARYLKPLYDAQSGVPQVRQLMGAWHLRSGMVAEKKSDFAAAEQHYREGVAIDPDEPELHASLGVLCLTQGRVAEALDSLEAYRRLRPANPRSSLFLGQAYAQLGRIDDARRILTEGEKQAERSGNPATAAFCREILQQLPR